MTEFIIYRLAHKRAITAVFNRAAKKLKANNDVKILDSNKFGNGATFLVETSDKTIEDVKKALPGWTVKPNQIYWSTDF